MANWPNNLISCNYMLLILYPLYPVTLLQGTLKGLWLFSVTTSSIVFFLIWGNPCITFVILLEASIMQNLAKMRLQVCWNGPVADYLRCFCCFLGIFVLVFLLTALQMTQLRVTELSAGYRLSVHPSKEKTFLSGRPKERNGCGFILNSQVK